MPIRWFSPGAPHLSSFLPLSSPAPGSSPQGQMTARVVIEMAVMQGGAWVVVKLGVDKGRTWLIVVGNIG